MAAGAEGGAEAGAAREGAVKGWGDEGRGAWRLYSAAAAEGACSENLCVWVQWRPWRSQRASGGAQRYKRQQHAAPKHAARGLCVQEGSQGGSRVVCLHRSMHAHTRTQIAPQHVLGRDAPPRPRPRDLRARLLVALSGLPQTNGCTLSSNVIHVTCALTCARDRSTPRSRAICRTAGDASVALVLALAVAPAPVLARAADAVPAAAGARSGAAALGAEGAAVGARGGGGGGGGGGGEGRLRPACERACACERVHVRAHVLTNKRRPCTHLGKR